MPFFVLSVSTDGLAGGAPIWYDASGMSEVKSAKRLTESVPGRLAGWLLALVWLYSLPAVDSQAFTAFPVCVGLGGAAVLVLLAVLMGCRVVRMSWLGWVSLAAGGYFLCRCLNSYATVESWGESALIVGAFVYYIAGVYVAQNRRYTSVILVLALALVLSIAAWWIVKQPWFCALRIRRLVRMVSPRRCWYIRILPVFSSLQVELRRGAGLCGCCAV